MMDLDNRRLAGMLNKVPEVTLAFWVIKIMSTTVGETGADYLAVHVGLGTAVTDGIMAVLLIVSLLLQLRARQYVPWRYWLTVVLVSVVGTQITDALTDGFEVSLYLSTAVFAVALALTFAIWFAIERTLSIHTIVTTRRELFYWTAILFTFALGTAAGDLATEELQLGFRLGVVIFSALIAGVDPRLLSGCRCGADLLGRLRADPAARGLARRLPVPGPDLWRHGAGDGRDQHRVPGRHHHPRDRSQYRPERVGSPTECRHGGRMIGTDPGHASVRKSHAPDAA